MRKGPAAEVVAGAVRVDHSFLTRRQSRNFKKFELFYSVNMSKRAYDIEWHSVAESGVRTSKRPRLISAPTPLTQAIKPALYQIYHWRPLNVNSERCVRLDLSQSCSSLRAPLRNSRQTRVMISVKFCHEINSPPNFR